MTTAARTLCLHAVLAALSVTLPACSGHGVEIGGNADSGTASEAGGGSSSSSGGSSSPNTGTPGGDSGSADAGCASPSCPVGSYLESCTGCTATASELSCAACAEGNGSSEPGSLPLPCTVDITNCLGELTCGACACASASCPPGSYLQSCAGCSATSSELSCAGCKNSQGGTASSSMPLPCSQDIADCDGQLTCGGC